jgi:ABC-type branched-subunit amino acid transport system substrate-binding protein
MRASLALVTALALLASLGCGSAVGNTVRIGIYGDCYGPFTGGTEQGFAGAELPFVRRGAKPKGPNPTDGVGSVTVGGTRVELVHSCEFFGSPGSLLAALRDLVERQKADIVIVQGEPSEAQLAAMYPSHQPGVAFVSTALFPLPPQPNLFGVTPDLRQAHAGLGTYAYRKLGWRTAVTIGEDDPLGWSSNSGFVAEFCSLGGKVVRRLWKPAVTSDLASLVDEIPPGTDGVALMTGLINPRSFLDAYRKVQPDLGRHVVMSGTVIADTPKGRQPPAGIMASGFLPFVSSSPAWNRYIHDLRAEFPGYHGRAGDPGDQYMYDAVELTLQAVARVHGDLSGGERRLKAALTEVHAETPLGRLSLDSNRHAVSPNFLIRVQKDAAGKLVPLTVATIRDVDDSFGGYFAPDAPPDSETQPACHKGDVPSWAR